MHAAAQLAICLMVTGAIIAGATDLNFSMAGIIYVAICAVSTAVYLLLIRLLKDKTGEPCTSHIAPAHACTGAVPPDRLLRHLHCMWSQGSRSLRCCFTTTSSRCL